MSVSPCTVYIGPMIGNSPLPTFRNQLFVKDHSEACGEEGMRGWKGVEGKSMLKGGVGGGNSGRKFLVVSVHLNRIRDV